MGRYLVWQLVWYIENVVTIMYVLITRLKMTISGRQKVIIILKQKRC